MIEAAPSDRISINAMKNFVRHLCIVSHKYKQKELARQELKKQITKLKNIKKTESLKEELSLLEQRIAEVLEKENQILRLGTKDKAENEQLKRRMAELEKEFCKARQEHITKLIDARKESVKILGEKITSLKEKHREMEKSGKYKKADLKRVENKIKALTKRLMELK